MTRKRFFRKSRGFLMSLGFCALFCLTACSDKGEIRRADEAFLRELCGLPAEDVSQTVSGSDQETEESLEADGPGESGLGGDDLGDGSESGSSGSKEGSESGSGEDNPGDGNESGSGGSGEGSGNGSDGSGSSEESSEGGSGEGGLEEGDEDGLDEETRARDQAMTKALVGTWKSDPISVKETVWEAMAEVDWLKSYVSLEDSKLAVSAVFTFSEDGSAALDVDGESYQALMDYLTQEVSKAALQYFDDCAKAFGISISAKQYLRLMGISLEDYVEDMIRSMAGDLNEESFRWECHYKIRDGKLYAEEDATALKESNNWLEIRLEEDALDLLRYYENGKQTETLMGMEHILPIRFHKQQ